MSSPLATFGFHDGLTSFLLDLVNENLPCALIRGKFDASCLAHPTPILVEYCSTYNISIHYGVFGKVQYTCQVFHHHRRCAHLHHHRHNNTQKIPITIPIAITSTTFTLNLHLFFFIIIIIIITFMTPLSPRTWRHGAGGKSEVTGSCNRRSRNGTGGFTGASSAWPRRRRLAAARPEARRLAARLATRGITPWRGQSVTPTT